MPAKKKRGKFGCTIINCGTPVCRANYARQEDEDAVVLSNEIVGTLAGSFLPHDEKTWSKNFATFKLHLAALMLKDVKFDEKEFLEAVKNPEKLLGVFVLKEK